MSIRATSGLVFAWASIAADACLSTLYFANSALSLPMSTSLILPRAASMLLRCLAIFTSWNSNLDIVAPFWARNPATFSIAAKNTPTDMFDRLIDELRSWAARVKSTASVSSAFCYGCINISNAVSILEL